MYIVYHFEQLSYKRRTSMKLKLVLLLATLTLSLLPSANAVDIDFDDMDDNAYSEYFDAGYETDDFEANAYADTSERTASAGGGVGCPNGVANTIRGEASYYGRGFHGRPTFCGERFDQNALTAAVRQGTIRRGSGSGLRCGDRAVVTNRANGRRILVRITDTGGLPGGRVLDLSQGAASRLGFINAGHTDVTVQFCN